MFPCSSYFLTNCFQFQRRDNRAILIGEFFYYGFQNQTISAVILVLMLTIVAMIFFSHTVFYETLPDTMVTWERQVAAWAIACSWELTILVVVCNTELLVSKRIPIVLSICSGFVILFFIHAFESDLLRQEYLRRRFIGLLVASINIVFSSLSYRKWCESNYSQTLTSPSPSQTPLPDLRQLSSSASRSCQLRL